MQSNKILQWFEMGKKLLTNLPAHECQCLLSLHLCPLTSQLDELEINENIKLFSSKIQKNKNEYNMRLPVDGVLMFVSSAPYECFVPWHTFLLWPPNHVDRMSILEVHRSKFPAMVNVSPDQIPHRQVAVSHSVVCL